MHKDVADLKKLISRDYAAIGLIPNDYGGMCAEDVWEMWNQAQRSRFLLDHVHQFPQIQKVDHLEEYFDQLPLPIRTLIHEHVINARY